MTVGLIIAGGGLAALAAAAVSLRRRRETSTWRAIAARHGWEPSSRLDEEVLLRLRSSALMQIGHSRRFVEMLQAKNQTRLLAYVFETGFEHRRRSHDWRMAVRTIPHQRSRATITRLDWLAVTAAGPGTRELRVAQEDAGGPHSASKTAVGAEIATAAGQGSPAEESRQADQPLLAIVENEEEWRGLFSGDLASWLTRQPANRSWEILPGCIIGYEPGSSEEEAFAELESALEQLAVRVLPGW